MNTEITEKYLKEIQQNPQALETVDLSMLISVADLLQAYVLNRYVSGERAEKNG